MALTTIDRINSSTACYLRSKCKTEADRKFIDKLFAHNWEYFVIKRDERTNQLSTFVECCGADFEVSGSH
jgi:hypothetical protein